MIQAHILKIVSVCQDHKVTPENIWTQYILDIKLPKKKVKTIEKSINCPQKVFHHFKTTPANPADPDCYTHCFKPCLALLTQPGLSDLDRC